MKRLITIGLCLLFIKAVVVAQDDRSVPVVAIAAPDRAEPAAEPRFTAVAAQQALDRYLAEVEEIERVAAVRKEQARQRLVKSLEQAQQAEAERGPRYLGMLGSYHDNKGRIPFVLLSVPDGSNVLSRRFWDAVNKGYGLTDPLYRFEARGHVKIPAKGIYRLETGRGYGQVQLNGVSYELRQEAAGQPLTADVELDQGVYEVYYQVGNNGGQMNYSMLRISDAKRGKELPIFIYDSQLKAFLGDLSLGTELMEVSGWTPKMNRMK